MRANVSSRWPQAPQFRARMVAGAMLLALAPSLAGCFGATAPDVTGSVAAPTGTARSVSASLAERYKSNPGDKAAALAYAKGLRASNQHNQAVAVLETVAIKFPYDQDVLAAYGKALADAGRLKEAADVLGRAHTPDNPNWSVLSAQGSVADQLGDHAGAQGYYAAALKIEPDEPHVLSNLGLSYALDNQLPKAETTLERASASPDADMRVRQNYALVLALDGKFSDAQRVAERDLGPGDAAASVASIRSMIAQSNTWRAIQQNAAKGVAKGGVAKDSAAKPKLAQAMTAE